MNILKQTQALDETTSEHIPAQVIEDKGRIYLRKNKEDILIETDPVLYKLLSNKGNVKKEPHHLVLEANYNCNLSCASCFSAVERDYKPVPLKTIKERIEPFKGKIVSIAGGEPTLNKDLIKIIKIINKDNIASLTTNGLLLANDRYIKKLKDSGLEHVTLSFNGTQKKIYLNIEGTDLLEKKKKAFHKLKKYRFTVMLSTMVVREINGHNLGDILDFALENLNTVREVRLRSNSTIGKHLENPQFFLGEMLDLVCKQKGFDKKDIYKELEFKRLLTKYLNVPGFLQKSCGFSFHIVKQGKKYVPLGRYLKKNSNMFNFISNMVSFSNHFPYKDFLMKTFFNNHNDFFKRERNLLKVSFRSWPGKKTLDVQEHYYLCGTHFMTGDKKNTPTCYANIKRDIIKENKFNVI